MLNQKYGSLTLGMSLRILTINSLIEKALLIALTVFRVYTRFHTRLSRLEINSGQIVCWLCVCSYFTSRYSSAQNRISNSVIGGKFQDGGSCALQKPYRRAISFCRWVLGSHSGEGEYVPRTFSETLSR